MNKRIHKKKAQQNIENAILKLMKRKVIEQIEKHVLYGKEAKDVEIEDDCAEIIEIERNLKWIGRNRGNVQRENDPVMKDIKDGRGLKPIITDGKNGLLHIE